MKLRTIIIITFLSIGFTSYSQKIIFTKEEAIQDIDTMQKYIEEIHPNAYAYKSKEIINNLYERVKSEITDSLTIYQLYNYMTFLAAKYGNGHLSVIFPLIKNKYSLIPFTIDIDIENKKLTVVQADSSINIPIGAEIISINGIPANEIIDTMLIGQSGESLAFRAERVKSIFPHLLFSIYNIANEYEIVYKYIGKQNNLTVQGISYDKYQKLCNQGYLSEEYYKAKFLSEINTCLIDFRDFSDLNKFKMFLDTTFRKINKMGIQNLIIDLRNNSGGNSELGDELFQYIAKDPFSQYGKIIMKISHHLKVLWADDFLPQGYIDSTMLDRVLSIPNGSIINPDKELYNELQDSLITLRENPFRYKGTVYLLTGPATFSSAADFAWCFKHYHMGKIIGEETGGWGFCYGDCVYAELPYSRIEINVPCKLFYDIGATENDTHGVIPDYKIETGKALEYTIELIKAEK